MTIQQFIESAIKGGWKSKQIWWRQDTGKIVFELFSKSDLALMVLDPEAWKAVIKAHFKSKITDRDQMPLDQDIKDIAQAWMHNMINALCTGKTLEEYIATL